MSKEA